MGPKEKLGKTTSPSDLLLRSEVAKLFRVSERTVARWSASGKLPSPVRVGGVQRWRQSDIDRVIQEIL